MGDAHPDTNAHLSQASVITHISCMSPTRVGVIGAGVAGPVCAMLLKQKGYDPILYERLDGPSEAGLGLA